MTNLDPGSNPTPVPFTQNINWVQLVGVVASLLVVSSGGKINLTAEQQATIVTAIVGVSALVTMIMHSFVNHPANQKAAMDFARKVELSARGKGGALLIFAVLGLGLMGCASPPPITANPIQTAANAVASTPLGGTVVTGLQNSAYNLDQAIAIKVLPANDPADACVHQALQAIGQDVGQNPPPPVPQFTPKVSDLLSAGSVAYILAIQAKQLAANGGLAVPATCEQLVGHFVLAGVNAPANAIISAGASALP